MTSKEKYLKKIEGRKSEALMYSEQLLKDASWTEESTRLALKITFRLKDLGWTAKKLADKLDVTPQYVSKLLKGNEKFGFDILVKIQKILSLQIFADYQKTPEVKSRIIHTAGNVQFFNFSKNSGLTKKNNRPGKIIPLFKEERYTELEEVKEN